MNELRGGCHCGDIEFCIRGEVSPDFHITCHCRDCQQITGTGHARSLGVHKDQVEWSGPGETSKYTLVSKIGNDVETHFCGRCGTPIFKWAGTLASEIIFFHAGILDDESINHFSPRVEIWMHSKPDWDNLC